MSLHTLYRAYMCLAVLLLSLAICPAVSAAHMYGLVLQPIWLLLCLAANSIFCGTV